MSRDILLKLLLEGKSTREIAEILNRLDKNYLLN